MPNAAAQDVIGATEYTVVAPDSNQPEYGFQHNLEDRRVLLPGRANCRETGSI